MAVSMKERRSFGMAQTWPVAWAGTGGSPANSGISRFSHSGRGDLVEAERTGAEALRLEREHGNRHWALYSLTALARVALARGDSERAGLYRGAVEVEGARSRYGAWEASRIDLAEGLATESSPEFAAGRERAREIEFWDVAAVALESDRTEP